MTAINWSSGGFEKVSTEIKKRLFLSLQGMEKSGKTNFALTAPGPLGLLNLDRGLEGVVHKFAGSKVIMEKKIDYPNFDPRMDPAKIMALYAKPWDEFLAAWNFALKNARTVVVDSFTEAYELIRLARFGKLTQVMPHHYQLVNSEINSMMNVAYSSNANIILIHKLKDEYVANNRTGKKEFSGQKDVPFKVQINIETFRDEKDGEFKLRVLNCRQNSELWNEVFSGPIASFPFVAQAVYPETDISDWE